MRVARPGEQEPARVPETAMQAGEAADKGKRAMKRPIWTARMLEALERGVKGGLWFSLSDKVYRPETLEQAWEEVRRNKGAPGTDGQTVQMFRWDQDQNLARLGEDLRTGRYEPRATKRVWIPKPGSTEKRPLGIPAVRDRVVEAAVRKVIEPIFEHEFATRSYGFRPGRGCKDALRHVQGLLRAGHTWVVDADLKGYFDSIPHDRLMEEIRKRIADGRVLEWIEGFLKRKVLEDMKEWEPERGTPQGGVISPLLANIYLHPVDKAMEVQGYDMIRYADDFVIMCKTKEQAEAALAAVGELIRERGLTLHPEKTRIVNVAEPGQGFDFLGYHFQGGTQWPRKKSLLKLRAAVRKFTKRANGRSMSEIVKLVNQTIMGWFQYFKHSSKTSLREIDQWVRMRIRSILRKRTGRRGRGRGPDHQRWPNQFFHDAGLFCLELAKRRELQSLTGTH